MGVWIEMRKIISLSNSCKVTPFMGVWIEMLNPLNVGRVMKSHPLWVCGLKFPMLKS